MTRRCRMFLLLVLVGACTAKTSRQPGTTQPGPGNSNQTGNANNGNNPNNPNQTGVGNGNGTTPDPNAANSNQTFPTPPPTPPPPIPSFTPSPFLRVTLGKVGAYLSLNGVPFRMLGYEASVTNVTNYCSWNDAQLAQAFDTMASNSNINTVRMWFLQSAGGPPGPTNNNGWGAFDAAVAAAKARGLRIIATLGNQWGDCEPPYEANSTRRYKDIAWYQGGYQNANDGYPLAYRDFVSAVAERYAGETTIAFWQLMNEAEARDPTNNSCPDSGASAAAIRAFADDMVDVIHAVDGNHLINLGTQDNGYCGPEDANSNYLTLHDGKIDICEVHSYDPISPALPALTRTKIAACNTLGKPIFMGEMGFCRVPDPNDASGVTCIKAPDARVTDPNVLSASLATRARYFDARFQAGFAAGLSGMLIWQWSPFVDDSNNTVDAQYGVGPGDPVLDVMQKY